MLVCSHHYFLGRKLEEAPNPPSGLLFGSDITHLKFAGAAFPEGPSMPKFDDPFLSYYRKSAGACFSSSNTCSRASGKCSITQSISPPSASREPSRDGTNLIRSPTNLREDDSSSPRVTGKGRVRVVADRLHLRLSASTLDFCRRDVAGMMTFTGRGLRSELTAVL
jgi:hypothetical protein